jgi:ABC-type phosphate transport system substrate-binding protein
MKHLFAFLLMLSVSFNSMAMQSKVIVNPVNFESSLSRVELKEIFSLKCRYWDTGEKIKAVLMPWRSIEHKNFLKDILRINPKIFRADLEESFNNSCPANFKKVYSSLEMMQVIKNDKAAIGYGEGYMIMSDGDSLKIIEITD